MKRLSTVAKVMLVMLLGVVLSGCGNGGDAKGGSTKKDNDKKVFAIIYKNAGNPFGERIIDGFKEGLDELGYETISKAPDQPTAEAQITMIQELIAQNVDGIAISANDEDALQPALTAAMKKGIPVVSYDSKVNAESRMLTIQQADPVGIGEVLAESAYDLMDGKGEFAILSATSTASNQNAWIDSMKKALEDDKYKDIKLVKIAYGDDLRDKSTSETEALLQSYPNLKTIVVPTTVGMAAAAKVVTDKNLSGKVSVTGLGLPSEMAEYIENGVTPYMYLWNPIDIGYMTAYALDELSTEGIKGDAGDTFKAGRLGEKEVIKAEDGGTESILGLPFRFDKENIDEWKEVY